jgi:hypothetical protein
MGIESWGRYGYTHINMHDFNFHFTQAQGHCNPTDVVPSGSTLFYQV